MVIHQAAEFAPRFYGKISTLATWDRPAMTIPPIRLAFGATLWRIFAFAAVLMEISIWHRLERFQALRGTGFRIAALIYCTPKIFFKAFLWAAIITVLVDLYVRLIMRPILARWYTPRPRGDEFGMPVAFRLAASETVLEEIPARMVSGRSTSPGTLIRTDRRLWFSPFGWDREPWSMFEADMESASTVTAPSRLGSLIRGLPQRLCLRDRNGAETRFVLADPRVVLRWYTDSIDAEPDVYQPSPVELF